MGKTTGELLEILKRSSLEAYFKENGGELIENPLCNYINALINEKNLKKSDVIKKSNLSESHAYEVFSDKKTPSRDKLISLCFGMGTTLDEIQTLLKYAGYAQLYPRNKRDSVIIDALRRGESVVRCNITLDELGLSPL